MPKLTSISRRRFAQLVGVEVIDGRIGEGREDHVTVADEVRPEHVAHDDEDVAIGRRQRLVEVVGHEDAVGRPAGVAGQHDRGAAGQRPADRLVRRPAHHHRVAERGRVLQQVVRGDPSDLIAQRFLANHHQCIGVAHGQKGELDEAMAAMERAQALYARLARYCMLLGRRAALWHSDVSAGRKRALLRDPPDCLLTTPESLEVMLVSGGIDARALFASVLGDCRGRDLHDPVHRLVRDMRV